MNPVKFRWLSSALLVGLVSSCAFSKPNKPPVAPVAPVAEGPKLIGRIASLPADRRFVLVQSYGEWKIEEGRILTTRGADERSANLRVTGESLGDLAAADIQAGTVEVGDAVYAQHVAKAAKEPEPMPAAPETQEATPDVAPKNN